MGAIRTSEFWVSIALALGQGAVAFGWIEQEAWDKWVYPAITYVVARVTSKFAKGIKT